MNWPELQIEHLGAALIANWLALGWFSWSRAQTTHPVNLRRDTGWNWIALAALIGALQLIVWLALTESRLTGWPGWARSLFAAFAGARGIAAALAAATWFVGPSTRSTVGIILLTGAVGSSLLDSGARIVALAGWSAAGLALVFRPPPVFPRGIRFVIGVALLLIGAAELATPDLTQLALRLPSEQPLSWGSWELAAFSANAFFALVAGLALWTGESQRRRRFALGYFLLAGALVAVSGSQTRERTATRDETWKMIETVAGELSSLVPGLTFNADATVRTEYVGLAEEIVAQQKANPSLRHLRVWATRDTKAEREGAATRDGPAIRAREAIHIADAANFGDEVNSPRIPPGYRFPELPNLTLQAARGVRFESGSFFLEGAQYMGMNFPVGISSGMSGVWLQAAIPLAEWKQRLDDPRVPAVVGLLYLSGLAAMALAGRVWLMGLRQIHQQAIESEAAARAKNEMAGLVSHELRTPLQVVLGHLEILKPAPLAGETRRVLGVVEDQCRHLLALVNDTLDLCALEARTLRMRRDCFDPGALAAAALDELRPLAAARNLALSLEIDPLLPRWVETDERRLRQILTNLLANAVKYTSDGRVRLQAGVESGEKKRLVLAISDTGPGMPRDVLERLGEPFLRPFGSAGTGLGLSLVQRLCRHLDGELTVKNAVGGGCVATVRVFAPPGKPAPALAPPEEVSPAPQMTILAGMRIVVADDNAPVRELIGSYLRQLGAEVETASDGDAALAACRTLPRDAIVLDVAMPGMQGTVVAWKLRHESAPVPRPARVIGLSAQEMEPHAAHVTGFDHFLVKPVVLAELAALLGAGWITRGPTHLPIAPTLPNERLRSLFLGEAPAQLIALQNAVALGDREEVARLSHYLQSSAYALSDEPLRSACAALRLWAESGASPEEATAALTRIEIILERLLQQMR